MEPLLYENDLVYFEKPKQIKINDIVLIKKKQLFIHRVIYKNSRYFVTKGDNNLISDGKIKPGQIFGRVVKVKRAKYSYKPASTYLIQSSLYLREIIKVKNLLEKNKIEFVFLKGLPLHFYFEGAHPKRLYADCDILIDKKYYLQVEKILLSNGYKATNFSFLKKQASVKSDSFSERSYQKIIQGFPINFDVHLEAVFMMTQLGRLEALYPQKLINQLSDEFIKTKRVVKINNKSFFILNSKFLILYLALHFFHHNFRGAFRLDFLNKVIRKSHPKEKDWLEIAQITNKYQLENFVSPVFLLLKKYYLTPIPDFMYGSVVTDPYKNINIFDSESRISSGIARFKNIFVLSPYPLWKKIFVFVNLEVIYLVFFVLKLKLFYFLKGLLGNR